MASDEPTYGIDPIEPDQVGVRFAALLDRLEPVLIGPAVASLRGLLADGQYVIAYARLDAITNDGTISVDTGTLVELVLLGQAIGPA